MLEVACSEFECLQKLLTQELTLTAQDQFSAWRAYPTIQRALAKSFLFNVVRAYRICEHGKHMMMLPRELWKQFEKEIKPVVDVRDVNEHGFDVHKVPGRKNNRPTLHHHEDINGAADETSMIITAPNKIIMGPLNLYEVYVVVAEMRKVAGFHTLPPFPIPPEASESS